MGLFDRRRRTVEPGRAASEERDTDADWQRLGDEEPFFGVFTHAQYLRENLNTESETEFFESGVRDVQGLLATLRHRFGPFEPRSALDFGCGVGRLTRALAQVTGDAVGIDISDGMLREARRRTPPNASFEKVRPDRLFDWLVSLIVFQHIPPKRGYVILADLLSALAPGGCVSLHFALWRDAEHQEAAGARFSIEESHVRFNPSKGVVEHPVGHVSMFDYDLSVIVALFVRAGINEVHFAHTDHGGYHGALLFGRRSS